jgi:broad specificity phosphatase PhoE
MNGIYKPGLILYLLKLNGTMKKIACVCCVALLLTACSKTYYIVRHAEKEVGPGADPNDPPLTDAGRQRAVVLAGLLAGKHIKNVFSTQRKRTDSTARPTARQAGLTVQYYKNDTLNLFLARVKKLKSNTLIVGHSNTIDDIANGLTGRTVVAADVSEAVYDNFFVVRVKGKRISFRAGKYGAPTP